MWSIYLDYKCELVSGDGGGTSETKIGEQTGYDCVSACIDKKKTDNAAITGVSVYANDDPG